MSFIVYKVDSKGKKTQVSGEYSAPQFCSDFIALAKRTGGGNDLRIMVKQGRKLTDYQTYLTNHAGQ